MGLKVCESCGMPMKTFEDYGGANLENKYCKHCTDNQGKLKTYNQKVADLKKFLIKTFNIGDETEAEKMAKENLKQFPAWKNIKF